MCSFWLARVLARRGEVDFLMAAFKGRWCDLLARTDLRTTIKHHNRARGIEAGPAYARLIAARRRQNKLALLVTSFDRVANGLRLDAIGYHTKNPHR
jgi:hypothetical protein